MNGVDDYDNSEYRSCISDARFKLMKQKSYISRVNKGTLGGRFKKSKKRKSTKKKVKKSRRLYHPR
jgi:hypothetical protein